MKLPFSMNQSVGVPVWAVGTGDPIQVMLVDDDDDDAKLTRSLLGRVQDVNYELDWVPSFNDGLAAIIRGEHDAYLIDHQLGGRTGTELVRQARRDGSLAALIMLTGHRDRATDMAAMDAGATDFLVKGKTDAAMLDRTLRYAISQVAMISSLERSRNQMAGLEELGRILVHEGPAPSTMARVVALIVDRFGLDQVAIYLADGDTLYLAGQQGYTDPIQTVNRHDTGVDRVARAGKPIFIPSLGPEPSHRDTVATELSVPLMLNGELIGLLNVASPVAMPIGEHDYAAIRLVADRLTAALEVTYERKAHAGRLAATRTKLTAAEQAAEAARVFDPETDAYREELLEPMIDVAIASASRQGRRKIGLLLVASGDGVMESDFMGRLATQADVAFSSRPRVRSDDGELAVLFCGTEAAMARGQAADMIAAAGSDGLRLSGGFASLGPSDDSSALVATARAALILAQRTGPGTLTG